MTAAVKRTSDVHGLRLLDGEVERPQPAPRKAPRRLRRVGRVRLEGRGAAASGRAGNEDVFCTDYGGGFVGMSFRFFDPDDRTVVDLLGRQPRPGPARPAGDRLVLRRRRRLRGRRHVRRPPDPRALHVVGRSRPRRRAGSRRSRTTAAKRGRRTGSWTSRGRCRWRLHDALEHASVAADYRHAEKFAHAEPSLALGDTSSSGTTSLRTTSPCRSRSVQSRAAASATQPRRASSGTLGRARLRRPPPLRRGLLLPPRLHVAQRERALGDGLGEERRERRPLPPVADRGSPSPDVLRVGARRRGPRARCMDALPPLRA